MYKRIIYVHNISTEVIIYYVTKQIMSKNEIIYERYDVRMCEYLIFEKTARRKQMYVPYTKQ